MKFRVILGLLLAISCQAALALAERHLMIIRHAEGECDLTHVYHSNPHHGKYVAINLTERGRLQMKQTAEILLNHGFDNRSITAIYVSPLSRAVESAQMLVDIGLVSQDKIHIEKRLTEIQAGEREGKMQSEQIKETWLVGAQEALSYGGESNLDVRKRVLAFYDEIEKAHPTGHVVIITHGIPALELIDALSNQKIKLELAQAYLLPLTDRNSLE